MAGSKGGKSLGNAYVSVVPRMTGFAASISQEFSKAGVEGSRSMKAKLGSAYDEIEKDSNKRGSKVGKAFGSAFTKGLGAIGAVLTVASGFADIVSQASAASDSTAKFASTLEFAGVQAGEIDRLTESTKAYADATVYDLGEIRNVTAQLAANGVADYDRLAEAAGNLNAVAGGNAETFSSVGMVLTQTAGAGKLTTENFNQLADAIPGASGVLQQELANMGAYTGNFRDAMAAGEITAEEFNQAILNLGFDEAAVSAAKSTETFEGAFGNLEASVVSFATEVIDVVKPAIIWIVNALADFVGTATRVFGAVADVVGGAVQKITGWWSSLNFEWPRIKLPHFTFSGSLNPFDWGSNPPRIGVEWYAKGGLFDGAQVIGVGERGPEAVVPLYGREMQPFAQAIADNLAGMQAGGGTVNVYIDGDALTADARMIALLREFVAGAAEKQGRRVVFA